MLRCLSESPARKLDRGDLIKASKQENDTSGSLCKSYRVLLPFALTVWHIFQSGLDIFRKWDCWKCTFMTDLTVAWFAQHNPGCSLNCVSLKTDYQMERQAVEEKAEGWWELRWWRLFSLKFNSHLAPPSHHILCAHGSLHCHSNVPFNHNRNLISCSWQRVLIARSSRLHRPFPRPTSSCSLNLPAVTTSYFLLLLSL